MASADRTPTTLPSDADVDAFLAGVTDAARRADTHVAVDLMARVTGQPPRMWGPSIIGFGTRHYRYESGRQGDSPVVAVSPRKAVTTLYLWNGFAGYAEVVGRLGRTTTARESRSARLVCWQNRCMATVDQDPGGTAHDGDVEVFVASIADPVRREDARTLIELIGRVTGEPPLLWGTSVVGFGHHTYRYPSGLHEDTAAIAFSPRKADTTLYLIDGADGYRAMLVPLGPHKISKGSLHLKRLADVDLEVLAELVRLSYAAVGRLA